MEIVPFPVRRIFRVLALGLAAAAFWAAWLFLALALESIRDGFLLGAGLALTALAFVMFGALALFVAFTSGLPRAIVGPDDERDPTEAV